ncbi:hypothetical protein F5X68DRAFT_218576 [Plectosphaerella plurivora]|uniref:Uncharacterized protein n=1 Tax=Plectosphaerella plurivora TaxID=936078 RepID=A0A9P9A514_9PEZI|nr:hypothetical protein F5X68DRAFT_218576 [Plectosphaerella plurivora]
MARRHILSLLGVSLGVALAQNERYITELPLYSLLAPCAQSALSQNVMQQTSSCGENNNLQSCVCTKDQNYAAIGTSVSSSLSWSCGETATEDFTSASIVYSAYCTPDKSFDLPTPTANLVNDLVTDIPEFFNLARCAQSALSYAAIGAFSTRCPTEPVAAYAGCMCTRNRNSAEVNSVISASVSYSCENNAEDRTSALDFFSAYCAMGNGTTNLPLPTPPPGAMTYYISALPQYSNLVSCAQTALGRVVSSMGSSLCPDGPGALASCVCLKTGLFRYASSLVTASVKYSCESTALEDVTSAIGVLNQYCSEARGEATATGLESIEQTYAVATGRTVATAAPLPTGSGAGPAQTSGAGGTAGGSSSGGNGDGSSPNNVTGGGTSVAAIAGGVAAGAGAVLIIGLIAWLIIRRRKKAAAAAAAGGTSTTAHDGPGTGPNSPPVVAGKPELAGQPLFAPPYSPGPGPTKESPAHPDTVSFISPYGQAPPSPLASELHGQGGIRPSEMPGTQYPPPSELHSPQHWGPPAGQQYGQSLPLPPELQGHQAQYSQGYGQQPQQVPHGQPYPAYGWQQGQGPYSELESGYQGGPGVPHAR